MQNIDKTKNTDLISKEDWSFIKRLFKKNLIWLLIIPVFSLVIGFVYSYRQVDVYGSKAQILLKSFETYDYQNQINSNIGYFSMYSDITNQKRMIQSYDLISEVIEDLNFDVSYFNEGRLRVTEEYKGAPFEVSFDAVDGSSFGKVYETPIYVSIKDENSFELKSDVGLNGEFHFNEDIPIHGGVISFKKAYDFTNEKASILRKTIYFIKLHSKSSLVNNYKSKLSVENIEGTTILTLQVNDRLAPKATVFLDSLTQKYVRNSKKNESKVKERTLFFINKQLNSTKMKLSSNQDEIKDYKDSAEILNLEKEELNYFDQMIKYETDLRKERVKKVSLDSLKTYVQSLGDGKLLAPTYYLLVEDQFLSKLMISLYDKQFERKSELRVSTENSSKVKNIDAQISELKSSILVIINNNLKAISSEVFRLESQFNFYKSKLGRIPIQTGSLLEIERERQVNEKLYNFLLEKKANIEIAQVGIVAKVSIIEEARSAGKVSTQKSKVRLYFILGGIVVALIFAFIRTVFFLKFENLQEIKEYSKSMLLAGVPFVKLESNSSLSLDFGPKSNVSEAFRGLRTNLEYLASEIDCKVILVSSIHPGEGKTFCSSNLSSFIAATNKKVVIVDFDLHKPKLHERFNLNQGKGLSNYLTGKSTLKDVMVQADGHENLDIVLAGPIPPNPSELILGGKVDLMIEELKKEYDYIIFDTPPVGLITDGLALMKYSHINIFVLSTKFANKKGVNFLEEIIDKAEGSSGLILNQIKQKKWRYYYKNYGYGYGYGQSYGE